MLFPMKPIPAGLKGILSAPNYSAAPTCPMFVWLFAGLPDTLSAKIDVAVGVVRDAL